MTPGARPPGSWGPLSTYSMSAFTPLLHPLCTPETLPSQPSPSLPWPQKISGVGFTGWWDHPKC